MGVVGPAEQLHLQTTRLRQAANAACGKWVISGRRTARCCSARSLLARVATRTDVGAGEPPAHRLRGAWLLQRLLLLWLPRELCGLSRLLRLCMGDLCSWLLLARLARDLKPGLLLLLWLQLLLWPWLPLPLLLLLLLLLLLDARVLARPVLQLMRLWGACALRALGLGLLLRGAGVTSRRVQGVVDRFCDSGALVPGCCGCVLQQVWHAALGLAAASHCAHSEQLSAQ